LFHLSPQLPGSSTERHLVAEDLAQQPARAELPQLGWGLVDAHQAAGRQ